MRHAPLFLSIAIALVTFAGGAHDATAQMPTAEEMQEMQKAMEEAQKQMEQMDPATRKQLEDLMAHPPAGAAGGSVSEAPPQVAGALDSVSRDPLDDDDLREFVEDLQPKLSEALSADARSRAQAIDAELQKYPDYPGRLRAAANGLAAWGVWPEAIWLSGRLAVQSGSAQDLSNLAAMLVMERAPGAALPILYSLDARYPGNTTVQNNIAQALYGAGDSEAAEEQLKAVIAAAPIHPQANATLALIQAARGDTAAAQESMRRATRGGFSPSKETELRKMGAELRAQDVAPLPRMPQDPLGLHRVEPFLYPAQSAELPSALLRKAELEAAAKAAAAPLTAQAKALSQEIAAQPPVRESLIAATQPFSGRVYPILKAVEEKYQHDLNANMERFKLVMKEIVAAGELMNKQIEKIDAEGEEKYSQVPGGYQYDYSCGAVRAEMDRYLGTVARLMNPWNKEQTGIDHRYLNESTYLLQFVSSDKVFELAKVNAKAGALRAYETLNLLPEGLYDARRSACFSNATPKSSPKKLADFDDIHCMYISRLDMLGVGAMEFRCNSSSATFNPLFAPFNASWEVEAGTNRLLRASAGVKADGVEVSGHSEFDTSGWKSGGISAGVSVGIGPKVAGGPLEIGLEGSATVGIEVDRGGVTDVVFGGGIEASGSSTIGDTGAAKSEAGVKAGANSSWSWNAGYSGEVSAGFDSSVF